MEQFRNRRPVSLAAGIILNLLGGIGYAWSVLVLPLNAKFGWSLEGLALAYTINSVTMLVSNLLLVPTVRSRCSLKQVLILGGVLYSGGVAFSGYMQSLMMFYIVFSVISGIGNSFMYPVLISYSQKLYPEKPGFASGLMAAGLGLGSVIWASTATYLIGLTGDVSTAMTALGVLFFVGIMVCAFVIKDVPEGFSEFMSGSVKSAKKMDIALLGEKNRSAMLADPMFYAAYPCLLFGSICGTMIIAQGSPIMQFTFGISPAAAAAVVSIFSAANTAGRPIWGIISDKIGRVQSFIIIHAAMAACMCVLYTCRIQAVFVAALVVAMFCFGGVATLVAPITADLWGRKYLVENYGITYTVFGMSSIVAAPVVAMLFKNSGSYGPAFILAMALSAVGLLLAVCIRIKTKNSR